VAILLTKEGGKPLPENRDEVEWIAACLDYYAEMGRDVVGKVISPVARNQFNFVVKEPYGVAGLIVPWNYPLLLLVWKLPPPGRRQHGGGQAQRVHAPLHPAARAGLRGLPRGSGERGHGLRPRGGGGPRGPP